MSEGNPWSNRRFIEPGDLECLPNRRQHLCLEDTIISVVEDETGHLWHQRGHVRI